MITGTWDHTIDKYSGTYNNFVVRCTPWNPTREQPQVTLRVLRFGESPNKMTRARLVVG